MLKIINPATESLICELKTASTEDVQEAFKQASEAQKHWAEASYFTRARVIANFRNKLEAHSGECAEVLSSEMGKPVHHAMNEIKATLQRIDWFVTHTVKELNTEAVQTTPPMSEEISYEPLGVIGNISAWNYPYFVGSNVFLPALLTGNAVLYKPSEFTSLTGLKIAALFEEAGLPPGLFRTLLGEANVGQELCKLPLGALFFTGSYATGQKIATSVAPHFTRLGLELGGKDPAYICDDVDVKAAVDSAADGAFYNAGQSCCAVERIYVHEKIYDAFLAQFRTFTEGLVVGDPKSAQTYVGPLARKAQIAVLEEQVRDALAKGARYLVQGGKKEGPGNFFKPSVLVDVDHSMKLMREESFGPIIGIQKVRSDEEALSLMNDCEYGLTASVYTPNRERATRILRKVQAGTAYWNCCDRVSPYLPWSGRKHSGMGSTLSHLGIKAFLQPKAWHLKSI